MAANAPERSLPVDVGDEPLIGWRCWHVLPHEGLLRPIFKRGLVWKPRQALEALCPENPHEVPADNCKCGVWTVCHPMLLDEIGWTTAPPTGIRKLPGVMVVGEVSLWGKIIQHDRGWRASFAYPRHLYVFTDDPMIAETLRERYGVPVEWGADAERLRRMLPLQDAKEEAEEQSALRETLLDVLRTGLCPKPLEDLTAAAVDAWGHLLESPEKRIEKARAALASATTANDRGDPSWRLAIAAADVRVLQGDTLAARRALWVRLARWQRSRGADLLEKISHALMSRDELLEDLSRGTARRTNGQRGSRPYAAQTLKAKRHLLEGFEQRIAGLVPEIEQLLAVPIPTYREWCAIANGVVLGSRPVAARPSEDFGLWHRRAMQREQRLATLDRELALQRHQLNVDRAALEERLTALEQQRATLRDDVVDGVQRDHADLLRAVGELETRRRAELALAVMEPRTSGQGSRLGLAGHPELRARLRELGISAAQIAIVAGCSRATVHNVLTGLVQESHPEVLGAAHALIAQTEARAMEVTRGAGQVEAAQQAERRRQLGDLKARLRDQGITQAQVATVAGVTRSEISQVFAGRCTSVKVVSAARRLLGELVTTDELRAQVKATCARLGISQNKFAVRAGVSSAALSSFLRGMLMSRRMAERVRTTLTELAKEEG